MNNFILKNKGKIKMMSKKSILLVFLSLIMISLCVSTVVAADNTDKSVDDTTIQQDDLKSVDTTQTATDALKKGKAVDNKNCH